MSWKDLLVKAKLIESDADTPAPDMAPFRSGKDELSELELSAPPPTPTSPDGVPPDIEEGTPLEDIYASSGVPATPYPAERLLKVLDGLRAMDATHQRAAVAAMDAADDSWSLEGVLADAAGKVVALKSHLGKLSATVAAAHAKEERERANLAKEYEALCTTINQQMAELQEALRLATADNANAIKALESHTRDTVSASQREQLRIQVEIDRLDSLSQQLGSPKNP